MKATHGNMKGYMTTILRSSLLLLAVAGGNSAFAQVPKADCKPLVFDASSTMTITQPGVYCMTSDLIVTSFDASSRGRAHLAITSDNVTVDFNGYTMKSAGSAYEIGVAIEGNRNVALRNGRLSGFWTGIYANAVNGLLIEDMQLDACDSSCITAYVSHSTFRKNIITKTAPTTSSYSGIYSYGNANKFIGNSISGLNTTGVLPIAGLLAYGTNAVVDGNNIVGDADTSMYTGIAAGNNSLVINNRISNVGQGIFLGWGSGNYSGNMTVGVTTPYTGGTDKGNNY